MPTSADMVALMQRVESEIGNSVSIEKTPDQPADDNETFLVFMVEGGAVLISNSGTHLVAFVCNVDAIPSRLFSIGAPVAGTPYPIVTTTEFTFRSDDTGEREQLKGLHTKLRSQPGDAIQGQMTDVYAFKIFSCDVAFELIRHLATATYDDA